MIIPGMPVLSGAKFPDVEFVSGGGADAATVAIPTHQAGDMIIIVAGRYDAATAPSLPAGWTEIVSDTVSAGGFSLGYRVGYKFATAGSETSGTWTNATRMAVAVYRNAVSIGNIAASKATDSSRITWPALSLDSPPGLVLGFAAHAAAAGSGSPPAGYTFRGMAPSSSARAIIMDTGGPVPSVSLALSPSTANTTWLTSTVELKNR